MFENTFKNIDNVLWKDEGCSTELDYIEQTSWVLFLKYLSDLEQEKEAGSKLKNQKYEQIFDKQFRWSNWAYPTKNGKIDHNKALTGNDLIKFVNEKLFPYLEKFSEKAESFDIIEYKIGEIFKGVRNKIRSGYTLREVINHVNELRFRSQKDKHEMSYLYEGKIRNMGNAGRNGGEYYTPRPLIRSIIKVVKPKIGERIYDGACGSAGFLVESYDYLKSKKNIGTKENNILQKETFFGKEKKGLAYIIGIMNMILHGIEAPKIIRTNTLGENIMDFQDKDRFDIILANPPFGGKERSEVQQNFPIHTGETAYLFLQHFIKILKKGGRCGVVIKNTFLSNPDNASKALRKQLLEECNLHTILDMPKGTFIGTGNETVVLFFEKGNSTKKIWYYQLNPTNKLGKTNPLTEKHLSEFIEFFKIREKSRNSWNVDITQIDKDNWDLSVKNYDKIKNNLSRSSEKIINAIDELNNKIHTLNSQSKNELNLIKNLNLKLESSKRNWKIKKIGDVCELLYGKGLDKLDRHESKGFPAYGANGIKTFSKKFLYDKPSIIVGRKGSAGELNYVEKPFWALDVTYYVKIKSNDINLRFLYYVLKQKNLPSLAKGVKPGINRKEIYAIDFYLPSIIEQKNIVKELESIFEKITQLQKFSELKFKNYEELMNAMLNKLSL